MAAIDHAEVRSLLAEIYEGYEIVDHLATLDPVTLKELIDDTIVNLDISKDNDLVMLKNSREEEREASLADPDNSVDEGQEITKLVARIFKTEQWLAQLNQTQSDFAD